MSEPWIMVQTSSADLSPATIEPKTNHLLSVQDLSKAFGGVRALSSVSLHVDAGEILGVIGPNGSGKTTLLNVLTGVTPPDSGRIRWDDTEDLAGKNPWRIFDVGVARTFQNIRLCLGLSILDNVLIGLYRSVRTSWIEVLIDTPRVRRRERGAREEAIQALQIVGPHLASDHHRQVGELSYADRRRVEIARAIVSRPRLLLLDEPTAGMNESETQEISDEITKVRATGVAIILIEHKIDFIAGLAGRIAVLNFGQKIAEGSYFEIRSNEAVIEAYLGRKREQRRKAIIAQM